MLDFNTRLVTSGCSLTDYAWPTWADYLGRHFSEHVNVAQGGSDNANVARHVLDEAKSGDTVIVMWSSFDRWNQYKDQPQPVPKDSFNHWEYRGTIRYDKRFLADYYHRVERFQTTVDYIKLIDLHSKVKGYTAYHFPAFSFFLGEIESEIDPLIMEIYNRLEINNNFLTTQALWDFKNQKNYEPDNVHPFPITHWEYLTTVMAPLLNVDIDPTKYVDHEQEIAKETYQQYL